ncbi:hypothetical protein [Escherichia coli]|uniref:F4 family fimbrial subunit n=1 Tax=Escherichia coli TaxID=562 RepID=UPI0019B7DD33|nr:Uncharacterised protein [Escherichia coli]CAD6549416.1 Uncharacterised protein [Escherichia coli]
MQVKVSQRGVDVRQDAVIDILLIIVFSLSLLICGKVSAATGWQSGGDFQRSVEFGGTITPYDNPLPPWLWKTGGYTGFSNKISELTGTAMVDMTTSA